ncbi:unnamed protein product, partial [Staurois parvus]
GVRVLGAAPVRGVGRVGPVSGEDPSHRECGVTLRDDREGLPATQPAAGRLPGPDPGPRLPLQPVRAPGEQLQPGDPELPEVCSAGGGFEPAFPLFEKCDVNGEKELPLFTFLKSALPSPSDDHVSLMTDPKSIIWSPVRRNDISWNFEKFLIGPDGVPYKRYSRRFETINIRPDIEELLKAQK